MAQQPPTAPSRLELVGPGAGEAATGAPRAAGPQEESSRAVTEKYLNCLARKDLDCINGLVAWDAFRLFRSLEATALLPVDKRLEHYRKYAGDILDASPSGLMAPPRDFNLLDHDPVKAILNAEQTHEVRESLHVDVIEWDGVPGQWKFRNLDPSMMLCELMMGHAKKVMSAFDKKVYVVLAPRAANPGLPPIHFFTVRRAADGKWRMGSPLPLTEDVFPRPRPLEMLKTLRIRYEHERPRGAPCFDQ